MFASVSIHYFDDMANFQYMFSNMPPPVDLPYHLLIFLFGLSLIKNLFALLSLFDVHFVPACLFTHFLQLVCLYIFHPPVCLHIVFIYLPVHSHNSLPITACLFSLAFPPFLLHFCPSVPLYKLYPFCNFVSLSLNLFPNHTLPG